MRNKIKKKSDKRKMKFWIYGILLFLFVIYVFFLDSSGFLQRWKMAKINKQLKEDIINWEKENKRLAEENQALKEDEKKLEEKAREFGLQKKGEEVFIFKKQQEEKKQNNK